MKRFAVFLFTLVTVASCGTESAPGTESTGTPAPETPAPGAPAPETPAPATPPPAPETPPPAPPPRGFPCEVHAVLQTYCGGCHLGQTYAPEFSTRDHMLASHRGMTLGQVAAEAVRTLRMPLYGAAAHPTEGEREIFLSWVAGGMPAGTCGALTRQAP